MVISVHRVNANKSLCLCRLAERNKLIGHTVACGQNHGLVRRKARKDVRAAFVRSNETKARIGSKQITVPMPVFAASVVLRAFIIVTTIDATLGLPIRSPVLPRYYSHLPLLSNLLL